jgi:hypothetical protein
MRLSGRDFEAVSANIPHPRRPFPSRLLWSCPRTDRRSSKPLRDNPVDMNAVHCVPRQSQLRPDVKPTLDHTATFSCDRDSSRDAGVDSIAEEPRRWGAISREIRQAISARSQLPEVKRTSIREALLRGMCCHDWGVGISRYPTIGRTVSLARTNDFIRSSLRKCPVRIIVGISWRQTAVSEWGLAHGRFCYLSDNSWQMMSGSALLHCENLVCDEFTLGAGDAPQCPRKKGTVHHGFTPLVQALAS